MVVEAQGVESITCEYRERRHGSSTLKLKNILHTIPQLLVLRAELKRR